MNKKILKDEKNDASASEKKRSVADQNHEDEFWDQFPDNESAVIDFIDRVIVNKDSTQYTAS